MDSRVGIEKEMRRRVEGLARKMQKRAEEVIQEMGELEGAAGAAERDLFEALGTLAELKDSRPVRNIICEDNNFRAWESSVNSASGNIPAQNYETDILPRYKKAISSGLASFHDHHRNAERKFTGKSIFNPWAVRGLLPHVIGSEEFIHDRTCGLVLEDSPFRSSSDPSLMADSKEFFGPDADSADIFGVNLFGMEQGGQPSHNKNDPVVSAASDFKAMLEAALRSPYKFYDEEGSSSAAVESDSSTWAANPDLSSLISGSLFDSEESTMIGKGDEGEAGNEC